MIYPFMTLEDETDGFHHATCYLPSYRWEDIYGFNNAELKALQEFTESAAHLIIEALG